MMAGIEWGILPITESCELSTSGYICILSIDTYFFRALDAASNVLESFCWEAK